MALVNGIHLLIYTSNPEADRAFFRDILGFQYVDVGHGWLIFGLPPAEAAFHPAEGGADQTPSGHRRLGSDVYLMCDDLKLTMESLKGKKVKCGSVKEERWGSLTTISLPGGGKIGLYQPKHPTAIGG